MNDTVQRSESATAELARRTAMLCAIGGASAAIVAAADWRRAIGDMLEELGRAAEASRASLFEVHPGPEGYPVQSCRFDWAQPPLEPLSNNPVFHNMSLSDDPEQPAHVGHWSQRRQRGEVVQATVHEVAGRIRKAYLEAGSLSFISVPVLACGRWWGFIGFDDCHSTRVWSPAEVDVLKTAAGLVASAIERQEAQGEVARRTALMDAVSEAAAKIVAPGDWRRQMDGLLRRLGEAAGVTRATLFEAHQGPDGYLVQSCRYDWAAPPLAPLSGDSRYHNMPLSDEGSPRHVPGEWTRRRQRGEIVQANLRELDGYARQVFVEHGTLSFLSVPVMVAGEWWGFLGFDDGKAERDWTSAELNVLRTAAALIGGAIERSQAEARLLLSEERYALAARGANDGLWDWDIATGQAYFSPRLHELLDLAEGELGSEFDCFTALLSDGDRRALNELLDRLFARRRNRMRAQFSIARRGELRHFVVRGLIVYESGRPRRAVGSLRDVTDWENSQRQLQEAERRRASLARYFSPNMVDELMQTTGDLSRIRSQTVTVLFADIMDFTRLTAGVPAEELVSLLREFLGLAEEAVFSHNGTLDKFLGDGLLATFGTPHQGPRDATNGVDCAVAIMKEVVAWNTRRRARGLDPWLIGIGLHTGPVALGDIGSKRRMEFAVLGETVNLASRIERMSRRLGVATVASGSVIEAVKREGGEASLEGFRDFGPHRLRGAAGKLRLWGRAAETLLALVGKRAGASKATRRRRVGKRSV
jgi:PAS domain S-box-containing protein